MKFGRKVKPMDTAAMKEFFSLHAEKVFFGLACVAMLLLLFLGYRAHSAIDRTRTPDALVGLIDRTSASMKAPRWASVYEPQRDLKPNLLARAEAALNDVSVDGYRTVMPWNPPVSPPQTKREDPQLLTVQELVAKAGYAAVSTRGGEERSEIDQSVRGEPLDAEQQNPTRRLPDADRLALRGRTDFGGTAKGYYFVCLTGLVPFQEQLNEYERCFLNAAGHNVARDYPRYFSYHVERAEVGADEQQLNWTQLPTITKLYESWAKPQEVAAKNYIIQSPRFLDTNFRLPPLLRQDLETWALHPKVPRSMPADQQREQTSQPADQQTAADDDIFSQRQPGFQDTEDANREEGSTSVYPYRNGDEEEGSRDYSSTSYVGPGSEPTTEFKLFRYFDYTVKPGKSYRYRVRLWLEDPNDPSPQQQQQFGLNQRMLSNEVASRIREAIAKRSKSRHYLATDWSEPSGLVTVPAGDQLVAGAVTAPRTNAVPGSAKRYTRPYSEPEAKVLVLQWDDRHAANVPVETTVRRGSMANFKADAEYLKPTDDVLELLKDYQFRVKSVVVDIAGGEPLPGPRGENLTTPGELLVLDEYGNLRARNELDDATVYEQNSFEPPEEGFEYEDETSRREEEESRDLLDEGQGERERRRRRPR